MSATDKHRSGNGWEDSMLIPATLGAIALLSLITYGSLIVGYEREGLDHTNLVQQFIRGEGHWPTSTTVLLILGAVLLAALSIGVFLAWRAIQPPPIDRAAPYMATDRDVKDLQPRGRKKAARARNITGKPLPYIAATLSGHNLELGPESTTTVIAGPRSGKSSSMCIPIILDWDGPVVTTSNKQEMWVKTRAYRETGTNRAWCFDPQGIAGEHPTWYWNPISYVIGNGDENMDQRAAKLAGRFAFATNTNSKNGDYFNLTGEGLVSALILAAALSRKDLLEVRRWVTTPNDTEPVRILRHSHYDHAARALKNIQDLNPDQRDGVYGTATTMTLFLTYRSVQPWITPGTGRTEFDPHQFVSSRDTLYSLSDKGQGSMGPLVTALTVAVCEAAVELAQRSPGERLATPMALVLDEVANVCRWAELPDVYSHYGSRGIIPISILQSWTQGAGVWDDAGMTTLWSSSTTRMVSSGVQDDKFHGSISRAIGHYTRIQRSTSHSRNGGSSSVQGVNDTILSVADLTAMPRNRAVIFEAGYRPILVKLVPWWKRGYKLPGGKKEVEDTPARVEEPVTRIPIGQPPASKYVTATARRD